MKRVFALLCAAALAASLTACGGEASSPAATATPEPTPAVTPEPDAGQPTTEPEENTGETGSSNVPMIVGNPDSELSDLVNQIYAEYPLPIMTATNEVELDNPDSVQFYLGSADIEGIEAAVANESAIGSQAYSLILVRTADDVDAAEVAERLGAGVHYDKWVCVQADDMMVGAAGNIAMLVMVDSQLDISAQSVADAFVAVEGDGASCWKPETMGSSLQQGIPGDAPAELTPAG